MSTLAHKGAKRLLMPERIAPQEPRASSTPPEGDGWVHEIKHDGHRVIAFLDRRQVRLQTRAGNGATERFKAVAELLANLPARRAIVDDVFS